ncbi:N-acetyltransferase [Gordonia sp. zg691]|uniref:N-acetyltransferase n=1 Tax=Gordonia jinghuaiqii TaxID=2758710 RepID=A0A7D7LTU2_9ACTN|nr:GNAT family N-acetyltransferase [Gordonia jinghuaiqii]MBD0859677.1 N-acetyltransferase [Gordonia jinghuaiqii]MCR5976901.1 GNAT family N-acetyltransferase [Gordonia jinghuaiqii]QMT00475.1 N-acetyltransferase [Gordonia jinghuaiqii]
MTDNTSTHDTGTPDPGTPGPGTQDTVAVTRNDEAGRFEVTVNGEVAGFTVFKDRENQRIFPHTEVDEKFSGRGLATRLIGDALEATRRDGLRVVAVCPAVARYVAKHPEVADNVDPVTPAVLQFLG